MQSSTESFKLTLVIYILAHVSLRTLSVRPSIHGPHSLMMMKVGVYATICVHPNALMSLNKCLDTYDLRHRQICPLPFVGIIFMYV